MQETNHILNDERVITFMIWFMGSLGAIITFLGGWALKKIFSESKASRSEAEASRLERSEFTNALNHKFKALNSYVRTQERTSLLHNEKINNLIDDHREYKKKTDQHANILSRHDTDISNLKNKQ